MPMITVRNIPEDQYDLLQREARRHRTSINSEILDAIRNKAEELKRRRRATRAMVKIDKLRAEIAREFPRQTDSVELIRESRNDR
jgi:uncharacterized protein (DUF1778 family)